ncbi:hypothetical protein MSIBF_A1740007 [groundwater metagenome]|uniref:Uncharacterized protein n=1 Tax=groundwater metagenome TaxID=717931 RepID=A0A098EA43_9ZZZZ
MPYKREHIFCSIIGGVPEIVALNYSESANFFHILRLHMIVDICVKC